MLEFVGSAPELVAVVGEPVVARERVVVGKEPVSVDKTVVAVVMPILVLVASTSDPCEFVDVVSALTVVELAEAILSLV